MEKSENSSSTAQKSSFILNYKNLKVVSKAKTVEDLCYHVFNEFDDMGDPESVSFPNGDVFYWGSAGTTYAHYFVMKGRINEKKFIEILTKYQNEFKSVELQ